MRQTLREGLSALAGLCAIVVVWQLVIIVFNVAPYMLPRPRTVASALVDRWSIFLPHVEATLTEAVIGLAIGIGAGVFLATLMLYIPALEKIVVPILVIDQGIPKLALAPLFIIWFGYGMQSKIFISALLSFFPVLITTLRGAKSTDFRLKVLMHSLAANHWQEFAAIRAPSALPYIVSATKIAVPLSVVGAVVGEFVQADKGLGYMILISVTNIDVIGVFVSIIYLAAISLTLFAVVSIAEKLVLGRRFAYLSAEVH